MEHLNNESAGADFRMEVGPRRQPPKSVCNTEAREVFERA